MKRIYAILAMFLTVLLLGGCAAPAYGPETVPSATTPATTETPTTVPQETEPDLSSDTTHRFLTDDPVLIARREAVEAYMRKMGNLIWRCPDDILYTTTWNVDPEEAPENTQFQLVAGRLYRGIPYSAAGCTNAAFLAYTLENEPTGTPVIGGFTWKTFSGRSATNARLGNDCSSALAQAWAQVSGSFEMSTTQYMAPMKGYLRVGKYTSNYKDNTKSTQYTKKNGEQVMFAAYAQLQMGDCLVNRTSSAGHTMMAVEIRVVRNSNGTIDGEKSTVTIHEQTSGFFRKETSYFDPALGEDVYCIYGIDKPISFADLYKNGFLPLTCKELIDPSPLAEVKIEDSCETFNKAALCQGVLTSNYFMDAITMTLSDQDGTIVQQGTIVTARSMNFEVDLGRFLIETPEQMHGRIDPDALTPGQYHCTVTVRLSDEREITVRDFDFTVE